MILTDGMVWGSVCFGIAAGSAWLLFAPKGKSSERDLTKGYQYAAAVLLKSDNGTEQTLLSRLRMEADCGRFYTSFDKGIEQCCNDWEEKVRSREKLLNSAEEWRTLYAKESGKVLMAREFLQQQCCNLNATDVPMTLHLKSKEMLRLLAG